MEIVRYGNLEKRNQGSCPVPSQSDWLDGGAANEESKRKGILEKKRRFNFDLLK